MANRAEMTDEQFLSDSLSRLFEEARVSLTVIGGVSFGGVHFDDPSCRGGMIPANFTAAANVVAKLVADANECLDSGDRYEIYMRPAQAVSGEPITPPMGWFHHPAMNSRESWGRGSKRKQGHGHADIFIDERVAGPDDTAEVWFCTT